MLVYMHNNFIYFEVISPLFFHHHHPHPLTLTPPHPLSPPHHYPPPHSLAGALGPGLLSPDLALLSLLACKGTSNVDKGSVERLLFPVGSRVMLR